jgi:hypothetical protein
MQPGGATEPPGCEGEAPPEPPDVTRWRIPPILDISTAAGSGERSTRRQGLVSHLGDAAGVSPCFFMVLIWFVILAMPLVVGSVVTACVMLVSDIQ